ncbi:MAG: hypothetical protein AAF533_29685, partial [Acidobacteriota bacterium]
GGGALLIASEVSITIDGELRARGGSAPGCVSNPGAGGAIRLAAPVIQGGGTLDVQGGLGEDGCRRGGAGRIRLDGALEGQLLTRPSRVVSTGQRLELGASRRFSIAIVALDGHSVVPTDSLELVGDESGHRLLTLAARNTSELVAYRVSVVPTTLVAPDIESARPGSDAPQVPLGRPIPRELSGWIDARTGADGTALLRVPLTPGVTTRLHVEAR